MKNSIFLLILLFFNQSDALNSIPEVKTSYFYSTFKENCCFYKEEEELKVNFHREKPMTQKKANEEKSIDYHPKNLKPYLGIGLTFFLNLKNDFTIKKHSHLENFGFVKFESYVAIRQNLLFNLFVDCYLQKVKLQNSGIDDGSYRVGGSLGYRF